MDRSLFPILRDYTYLNTPASGILAKPILEWRRQHDEAFAQGGSLFREEYEALSQLTKMDMARFFNARSTQTVLLPNFSFGFNTLLGDLADTHHYLLLKDDYPSINYTVERQGLKRTYATVDEHLESRIEEAVAKHHPTVFAFSIVQYLSGIKIDLAFLKSLKRQYPGLLIVADGTQYCGTEPFDFENSGIDILIASGYKWMLAGYGNGFMLVKDEAKVFLYPPEKQQNVPKPQLQHLLGKDALSFSFEPGHQDTLAMGTLREAIRMFGEMDFAAETERLRKLVERAKQEFTARGLLTDAVVNRKLSHGTFFNLKGDDTLFDTLQTQRILCARRGPGIRVGFHIFNNEEDLASLLSAIDQRR
ncbi:aminotransferase class V-fold PLP-dependent enzyme [Sinomicrobium sp.]